MERASALWKGRQLSGDAAGAENAMEYTWLDD